MKDECELQGSLAKQGRRSCSSIMLKHRKIDKKSMQWHKDRCSQFIETILKFIADLVTVNLFMNFENRLYSNLTCYIA